MKRKKTFFLTLLGVLLLILSIFKVGLLQIKKIVIETNNSNCVSADILQLELGLKDKNILLLDESGIRKKIMVQHFCVSDVKVERKFFGIVKLTVSQRNPWAKITTFSSNKLMTLADIDNSSASSAALLDWSFSTPTSPSLISDEGGFIFEQGDNENLPIIFWQENDLKIGQQLDNELFLKIDTIFNKLHEPQFVVEDNGVSNKLLDTGEIPLIRVADGYLQIKTKPLVIFSLEKDIIRQLASLQLILQKAKINSGTMDLIDLRFEKPVVNYSSSKLKD